MMRMTAPEPNRHQAFVGEPRPGGLVRLDPIVVIAALSLPAPALAQDLQDLEYREIELDASESDKDLQVSGRFETAWQEFDNLDFRPRDETSDQSILDSDDRGSFAFTGLGIDLGYQVEPNLRLVVGASHRGLWGNDQFGNTNAFGGWMYFNAAYIDAAIPTQGDAQPTFRVGRQYYRIGGLGGASDYVLADVLDMVRFDLPLGGWGNLTVIPINVLSASADNDGANFVSYIGQSDVETFNFRGDTLTRRHGAVLEITPEALPLETRAYGFYTDIGAAGTGSDISYDGLLGNFADGDYVVNAGVRAMVGVGPVTPYAHFDLSSGIDRKEEVAGDVNCNGLAWGLGVSLDTTSEDSGDGLTARVSYFDAFGPAHGPDGLPFSHGYVGMKAQQTGGLIFNRFLGFHPTAYVSRSGVTDNPQDTSRKAGTRELHAEVGGALPGPLWANVGWWMLQDTGLTEVKFANLDSLTPPFGYARAEFAAEQRLGRTLGHELDLDLGAHASEHLVVFLSAGMVLPGDFYAFEIARVAGTALGTKNPAMPWALAGGTTVHF